MIATRNNQSNRDTYETNAGTLILQAIKCSYHTYQTENKLVDELVLIVQEIFVTRESIFVYTL